MGVMTSTNSPAGAKAASRAWGLVVAGYSVTAVALVAFLTINGASGVPGIATIGTAVLVVIGLLLPTAGMLQLRRRLGPNERAARYGFTAQALGLLVLLIGVVLVVEVVTLTGYILGAALIAASGVSAIAGAILLRGHYGALREKSRGVACLILGTALLFAGVVIIVGSDLAFEFWISQAENTVYADIGATVSACGCVLSAYSFYVLHNPG
jgi:hypothetical protein